MGNAVKHKIVISNELKFSLLFVFRNIISFILKINNGNYDLLYIFSAYIMFCNISRNAKMFRNIVMNLIPFVLMVLIESIFEITQLDVGRVFIIIIKIGLCIVLMLWGKGNLYKYNIDKCVDYIIKLLVMLTVIAFIFPDSNLWVHDDFVNKFSETRLKLIYLEPTYLALHLSVIMTYLFFQIVNKKVNRNFYIKSFLILCVILLLSAGMGGIGVLIIGLLIIITKKMTEIILNCRVSPFLLFLFIIIPIVTFVFICFQPALLYRLLAIISGEDSSVNYRIIKSMRAFINSMSKTQWIGLGLGNMNTSWGLELFSKWKIETVLANSYLYFFCENGILGILYVFFFDIILFRYIKKSTIKLAIFIMIIIYQFLGGYFTDPGIWFCYGIILMPVTRRLQLKAKL